jgi:hypothetical protein
MNNDCESYIELQSLKCKVAVILHYMKPHGRYPARTSYIIDDQPIQLTNNLTPMVHISGGKH